MFDFEANREYINELQVGEKVIETSMSAMHGKHGVVFVSETPGVTYGSKCVKWEDGLSTSVTHGTRRIDEQDKKFEKSP